MRFPVAFLLSYPWSQRSEISTFKLCQPNPTISLTDEEEELFKVLDTVSILDKATTLRVAGGWVRDKIIFSKKQRSNKIESLTEESSDASIPSIPMVVDIGSFLKIISKDFKGIINIVFRYRHRDR